MVFLGDFLWPNVVPECLHVYFQSVTPFLEQPRYQSSWGPKWAPMLAPLTLLFGRLAVNPLTKGENIALLDWLMCCNSHKWKMKAEDPICIWVRSWNCGCLVTWFCDQLIAKPDNKTAAVSWPDPYVRFVEHRFLLCLFVILFHYEMPGICHEECNST